MARPKKRKATEGLAHRFATALAGLRPSTRFAVFAVPALIACAGCDDSRTEADDQQYVTVGTIAFSNAPSGERARNAMRDGVLTNGEYDRVIDAVREEGAADDRKRKRALLDIWAGGND